MISVDDGLGVEALRERPSAVFMIRESGSVKLRCACGIGTARS